MNTATPLLPDPWVGAWREALHLVVPGPPVGAGRPRVVRLKNGHSHTFMPDRSVSQEVRLLALAREAWRDRAPIDGLVRVAVTAFVERPKKLIPRAGGGLMTKATQEAILASGYAPAAMLPAPVKPDLDNVEKLVWDGLVKAGVLLDDTRVVECSASRWYVGLGQAPRTEVVVSLRGVAGRWW